MSVRWLNLLLAVALTGCLSDQKREAARCSLAGESLRPNIANHDIVSYAAWNQHMTHCMREAGYEFSWADVLCEPQLDSAENPYCYEPISWVGRMSLRLELMVERAL